jgi:Xaa-Pro aminopeptidase
MAELLLEHAHARRVEDTMVVGDAGGEILTQFPRTLALESQ